MQVVYIGDVHCEWDKLNIKLTKGKMYEAKSVLGIPDRLSIRSDNEVELLVSREQFPTIEELRDKLITELCK